MKHLTLSRDGYKETRIHVSDDELVTEEIVSAQYMQNLLDANAAARSEGVDKSHHMGWHAARVDEVTYYKWMREWREKYRGDMTRQEFLAMKLNMPEHAHFRTGVKRL